MHAYLSRCIFQTVPRVETTRSVDILARSLGRNRFNLKTTVDGPWRLALPSLRLEDVSNRILIGEILQSRRSFRNCRQITRRCEQTIRQSTPVQCDAVYSSVHGVMQLLLWCVKTKRRGALAELNKLAMSREVTAPCRPSGATHTTNQLPSALPLPDAYACGDHTALILFSLLPMKPTESFSVLSSQRREDSGVTSHRQPRQCRGAHVPKTIKGAQSDPNYVSRLLARSECLPGFKNYSYATAWRRVSLFFLSFFRCWLPDAAWKLSTLLPFSWPQYQQPLEQSVRMFEGMSRPSIRVECVKYFVSKQYCLLFS